MTPQANKSVQSLRTAPSCIRTKRIFELLEAFYPAFLQILAHAGCETIMFTTALHSPKQAERWPRVRETFHDWCRRLLRHTRIAHV